MKRILIIIALVNFVIIASVSGQVAEKTTINGQKEDMVINMKMIEKYQNAEYSENQLSFTDLVSNYSFENIKLIAQAYNTGKIETSNPEEINNYLASVEKENNDNSLELYSEKNILASQK
jgi:hypothetical protein